MGFKLKKLLVSCSLVAGALGFSASSHAELILGDLAITGVGAVAIGPGLIIDFQPTVDPLGNGIGIAIAVDSSTGSFAPIVGSGVVLRDINGTDVPVGVPVSYADFVTFDTQPTWSITLTQLLPGVFSSAACGAPAAAGQTCSIAGAPFNFLNTTSHSSTVSAAFEGFATDTGTGQTTQVSGLFSATFSNLTFQQLLAASAAGNAVLTSYSGTITAVPEPASATMMLVGGLLVAGVVMGRRLRS